MKPNNQINTAAITGFTTRLLVSLFCFICVPGMAVKAQDSITGGTLAKGGIIRYTLKVDNKLVACDTVLSEDSYIFSDSNSYISIDDPNEKFHIGIAQNDLFTRCQIMQDKGQPGGASYAKGYYLVYDVVTKTMEGIPFDNGSVTVVTTDTGSCNINFTFSLEEKQAGRSIILEGEAIFEMQKLALH